MGTLGARARSLSLYIDVVGVAQGDVASAAAKKKKEKKDKKKTKHGKDKPRLVIGGPTNFVYMAHVGADNLGEANFNSAGGLGATM